MVQTKLGRYWEQAKRWFLCKMWPFETKSKVKFNLFKVDMPKYTDDLVKAYRETKVSFDPNLNYKKIYKNNVEFDFGVTSSGKAKARIRKRF